MQKQNKNENFFKNGLGCGVREKTSAQRTLWALDEKSFRAKADWSRNSDVKYFEKKARYETEKSGEIFITLKKLIFMINLKISFRLLTLVFEEVRKLSLSPAQALLSPDLALLNPRFQNLARPITIDPGCLPQKISQKLSLILISRDLTVVQLWLEQWT